MADFDLHFKELEKEALLLQGQKADASSHSKENQVEVENLVGKLDSNLYGMKKIFDSIGHLLDEGDSISGQGQNNINNNNNDGINSTK